MEEKAQLAYALWIFITSRTQVFSSGKLKDSKWIHIEPTVGHIYFYFRYPCPVTAVLNHSVVSAVCHIISLLGALLDVIKK